MTNVAGFNSYNNINVLNTKEKREELYLEIYLDVIFIINFFMDLILLWVVKKILKWKSTSAKILLGSAIGGIGACILALVPQLNQIIQFIISYFLICILMIRITFKPVSWQMGIKGVTVLYVATFFLGGLFNSLYYHSMLGYYFHELINGRLLSEINGWKILLLVMSGIIGIYLLIKIMNNLRKGDMRLYETKIFFQDKSISLISLLDTGNNLYDPIFKKPVIIVEYSTLKKLLSEEEQEYINMWINNISSKSRGDFTYNLKEESNNINVFMIPFSSIGKKKGLLPAIEIDKLEIIDGEEKINNKNIIMAIWDGQLSKNSKYQLILHRDLM